MTSLDERPICGCDGCEAFAVFDVRWPGKAPIAMCVVDTARAKVTAEAMGFALDARRIPGTSVGVRVGPESSLRSLLEID